jgi:hypothetical protein
MLAKRVCKRELQLGVSEIDKGGLISHSRLANIPLNTVWEDITIPEHSSGFEEFIEFLLLKPGLLILFVGLILFCALAAIGFSLTALLRGI